jgi:hypothetical protein
MTKNHGIIYLNILLTLNLKNDSMCQAQMGHRRLGRCGSVGLELKTG